MVEEDGFEPSKQEATDLQSAPFGHSGTPPNMYRNNHAGLVRLSALLLELVNGLEPLTC